MKKKLLTNNLITTGMIFALVASNPATSYVFAAENTTLEQSASTTTQTDMTLEMQETATTQEVSDVSAISEEEIDDYFKDTVFVGDSIMLGFRNYCMKQKDSFLNDIQFLAAGSFSVNNALWDVTEKSVHPVYKGQKRQIWESISMMNAKKVFLFFGMNDLNISGLEGTCEKYEELISKIKEKSPDVEIHIISMTYTLKGAGKGKLKNDTIREFNELLQEMASENGWGFLDMATPLSDENGDLAAEYCSDGFVHQSRAAYDVWTTVIRDYACAQLNGTTEYPVGTSEAEECPETSTAELQTDESEATNNKNTTQGKKTEVRLSAGFSAQTTTTE